MGSEGLPIPDADECWSAAQMNFRLSKCSFIVVIGANSALFAYISHDSMIADCRAVASPDDWCVQNADKIQILPRIHTKGLLSFSWARAQQIYCFFSFILHFEPYWAMVVFCAIQLKLQLDDQVCMRMVCHHSPQSMCLNENAFEITLLSR